jgi:hypothetical protein
MRRPNPSTQVCVVRAGSHAHPHPHTLSHTSTSTPTPTHTPCGSPAHTPTVLRKWASQPSAHAFALKQVREKLERGRTTAERGKNRYMAGESFWQWEGQGHLRASLQQQGSCGALFKTLNPALSHCVCPARPHQHTPGVPVRQYNPVGDDDDTFLPVKPYGSKHVSVCVRRARRAD